MKKFVKKIFIFVTCFVLLLIPFGNCFAVIAEASYGLYWAIAESAGVSISQTGLSVGSDSWNDFNESLWGDLAGIDNPNYLFNSDDGTVTVDASTYNAVLDRLSGAWGNHPTFQPISLNYIDSVVSHSQSVYGESPSASVCGVNFSDNLPISVYSTSNSSSVIGMSNQVKLYLSIPPHSSVYIPYVAQSSGTAYLTTSTIRFLDGSSYHSPPYTIVNNSDQVANDLYLQCYVYLYRGDAPNLAALGNVELENWRGLLGITVNGEALPSASATFSVAPFEIDIEGVSQIVEGATAIAGRKVTNPDNKKVTLTPLLPNNVNPLLGASEIDVSSLLEEGFFDTVHDIVSAAVSDGSITDVPDEEETNFLPWFMPLFEHLSETVDNLYTAISEFFSNQGSGTPVFPDEPPDFLGGGDGGIRYHVSGIWHYVVSFVQSLGGAFTLFGSVWNGLPSAMFAAVYAAAVVVIVVGLFKRYIG